MSCTFFYFQVEDPNMMFEGLNTRVQQHHIDNVTIFKSHFLERTKHCFSAWFRPATSSDLNTIASQFYIPGGVSEKRGLKITQAH